MRSILYYLMLATAMGPGFCALPQKLVQGLAGSSHCDKKSHHPCCPANGKSNPVNESAKGPCQCKEPRVTPTISKTTSFDILRVYRASMEVGVIAFAANVAQTPLPVCTESESPRNLAFTFLSDRDILRALQILLC
jgi:hypothetical protein